MGGMSGTVRGASKIETYLKYQEEARDEMWGDRTPPFNKKVCYRLMERDPDTGEWVLHYHVHT